MAIHKDAQKRNRQAEVNRIRNRAVRTQVRNSLKAVREAVASGDVAASQSAFQAAMSTLHRAAGKGVIHRNNAARRISRLNSAVKKLVLAKKA